MSTTHAEAQKSISIVAIQKADALSLQLCHLTEIVKLAAFAAEARRVLEGIKNAAAFRTDVQKFIDDSLAYPHNWVEMDDTTGHVLGYIARELGAINTGFTRAVYDLANGESRSPDKNGGAA